MPASGRPGPLSLSVALRPPQGCPFWAAPPALTGPDRLGGSAGASIRPHRWQNRGVSKSTFEQESSAEQADQADSEDILVARIAADRRAGRDTTRDVRAFLRVAAENNRAALDRLAK